MWRHSTHWRVPAPAGNKPIILAALALVMMCVSSGCAPAVRRAMMARRVVTNQLQPDSSPAPTSKFSVQPEGESVLRSGNLAPETAQPDTTKPLAVSESAPVVRGGRYCEVMIVRRNGLAFTAEVWSTQGVSACPEDCRATFDADGIKSETGAQRVVVNGPKIWLPNSAAPTPPSESRKSFGGIKLGLVATVDVNRGDNEPLKERVVPRVTSNTFNSGVEVHELVSPQGAVYVMQSMSLSEDPSLTMEQLATVETRLQLPRGWSYSTRVLKEDLVLRPVEGTVVVLQDRLKNTYQKR